MWGDQRVNCVLVNCVMGVFVLHCKHTALHGCAQSSVHELTGRRTVLFTNSSPPHRRCSPI
ncbi:unnamed protein product, partial [Staurois parvus]